MSERSRDESRRQADERWQAWLARLASTAEVPPGDDLDRRVREVATSTEVGQAIAVAPELEELFHRVVILIKERFGYYHVQIFLVDRDANELVLRAGSGNKHAAFPGISQVHRVKRHRFGPAENEHAACDFS